MLHEKTYKLSGGSWLHLKILQQTCPVTTSIAAVDWQLIELSFTCCIGKHLQKNSLPYSGCCRPHPLSPFIISP